MTARCIVEAGAGVEGGGGTGWGGGAAADTGRDEKGEASVARYAPKLDAAGGAGVRVAGGGGGDAAGVVAVAGCGAAGVRVGGGTDGDGDGGAGRAIASALGVVGVVAVGVFVVAGGRGGVAGVAGVAGNCTRRFAPQRVHLMVWLSAVTAAFSRVPHEPHVTVTTIASKTDSGMLIAGALALSNLRLPRPPERLIGHPRARS